MGQPASQGEAKNPGHRAGLQRGSCRRRWEGTASARWSLFQSAAISLQLAEGPAVDRRADSCGEERRVSRNPAPSPLLTALPSKETGCCSPSASSILFKFLFWSGLTSNHIGKGTLGFVVSSLARLAMKYTSAAAYE